jgi:hypothetical protein
MMDLEGMIKKIPSTEKILGVAWILSWVLAIWMYHIQFFLTGLFCLFLVLILLGKLDKQEEKVPTHKPPAVFSMDKDTNTLRVLKLYENGLKWDEHEVCSGAASLPTGEIKEGDVVEDCKGNVALRHVPSNTLFGGFNFEE